MKILLKIPLGIYGGYSRDGIGMTQALLRAGHDVYLHPAEVQAPLPKEVADLLTKPLVAPFDVTIVHLDPGRLEVGYAERNTTKRLIAWTMWEWESFGNLDGRSKLKKQLKQYDAIIGYDDVTVNCFKPYYKGPMFTLQGGFDAREISFAERDWTSDVFRFCMLGDLSARKAPFTAINAFSELREEDPVFRENARLVLKTVNPPAYYARMEEVFPGLRIIYDNWDRETLIDFYNNMHVLLAPSWGEGKNLPALEFMSSGGAVIATNWGGMAYWMNEDYAYPLDYELAPINPYKSLVRSAKVSVAELKRQMIHTFYNREEAQAKGKLASEIVPVKFSWDAVISRLVHEIIPQIPTQEILYNERKS